MEFDERFNDVVYAVEADSFSQHALWYYNNILPNDHMNKLKWENDHNSIAHEVGMLCGEPIIVKFTFAKLNDHRVVFYEAVSIVVNWKIVSKWVSERCPAGTRLTTPQSFHAVSDYIRKLDD